MHHSDLAHIAAVFGTLGAPLVLLARTRIQVLAGFVLLGIAEAGFAYALVPTHDLHAAVASPSRIGALVFAGLVLAGAAAALVRWPFLAIPLLLAAAPFRVPVTIGQPPAHQLLLPLYGVLAATCLACAFRAVRGEPVIELPRWLALPTAGFIALDTLSLLWSLDINAGSVELTFFILPFSALVAVAARSPFPTWMPRTLGAILIGESSLFAVVGLWQLESHHLFFSRSLQVADTYTTYFRVNSLFYDPNIYGRHLVLALGVVLVLLWRDRIQIWLAAALFVLLGAGLYISYSESSEITLFVITIAVTLFSAPRVRRLTAIAAAVSTVVIATVFAANIGGHSLRQLTSGRSRLVSITTTVYRHHPLAGVGVGAQPLASARDANTAAGATHDVSHTTPLTVAAELGTVGLVAYAALLASAVFLFLRLRRHDGVLALALATVFGALVIHSLSYSSFFEDPITWGALAVAGSALAAVRIVQPDPYPVEATAGSLNTADNAEEETRAHLLRRVARLVRGGARDGAQTP